MALAYRLSFGGPMLNDGHTHSGLGTHEHGLTTHEHLHTADPGWLSFVLRSQTAQDPDVLHKALSAITAHTPVLRVKGFAHVRDVTGHLLIQGVRTRIACTMETATPPHSDSHHHGTAHQHSHTPTPPHAHEAMAELVFIGYHLERHRIVAKLCEHTGTAWYERSRHQEGFYLGELKVVRICGRLETRRNLPSRRWGESVKK